MAVKRHSMVEAAKQGGKAAFSRSVEVSGGRLLFVSGHVARDEQRQLVGKGDIRAQTERAFANVRTAVEQAGGTVRDIVKITVFVKDIRQAKDIYDVRLAFFPQDALPASTMVEVSGFVDPDALIEVEAVAALP
ncbi:MAG: RidA family protein [Candidatus Lambdaproteobacteria bacterium]|nr:RidA family protein [Candidatus Lambdaproteobacteria bacterium]